MKKALMWAGGIAVALVVAFLAVVAMQPAQVHVERSRVIAASPGDVWPHVSDLRAFIAWSPWQGRDPEQKMEFSDPSSGVGAFYTWKGNDQVGSGKMTITGVEEGMRVEHDLEFVEPFPSKADVTTRLEIVEGGTKVTWGFDSENDFMGKAASLFIDMDAMLGGDFEQGLANLAGLAEADAQARVAREAAEAAAAAAAVPTDPEADAAPPAP